MPEWSDSGGQLFHICMIPGTTDKLLGTRWVPTLFTCVSGLESKKIASPESL
jgi:hypothetical protein